jgi:hypothetical protein
VRGRGPERAARTSDQHPRTQVGPSDAAIGPARLRVQRAAAGASGPPGFRPGRWP